MKFRLQWINFPGININYTETWSRKQLMDDFKNHPLVLEYLLFPKKKSSYVYIFDENEGMVLMTRIK